MIGNCGLRLKSATITLKLRKNNARNTLDLLLNLVTTKEANIRNDPSKRVDFLFDCGLPRGVSLKWLTLIVILTKVLITVRT